MSKLIHANKLRGIDPPIISYSNESYEKLLSTLSEKFLDLKCDSGRYHVGLSVHGFFEDSGLCLHVEQIDSMEVIRALARQLMIEFTSEGYDAFFSINKDYAVMTIMW